MRKLLLCGFMICLSYMILVGCSNQNTGSSSDVQEDESNVESSEETLNIEIMTGLFSEVPDMDNEFFSELQEKTDTELDMIWVPDAEYNTRFDLVLASGDIPEVIWQLDFTKPTLLQSIEQGAFWDLAPFLGDFSEFPNLANNVTPGIWDFVTENEQIWGIPRSRSLIDSGIKFRKDWLEEYDIPIPETLEDYKEALSIIVENDPSGQGTIGVAEGVTSSLLMAFGATTPTYNEEGGMIKDILTPQYIDLIEWLNGLYEEGLIATEFSGLNGFQQQDMLRSGRLASYTYSIYRDFSWTEDIQKVQPEGELMTLPPLEGPAGYTAQLATGSSGAYYISKKVPEDKVRRILQYFEQTASEEMTDFAYYGIEGVHHEIENDMKVLTELGREQVDTTALQPFTPGYVKWGKVHYPGASKEENEAKEEEVAGYEELGKQNPFNWLHSSTWVDVWPNYQSEFDSKVTQAIVGEISIEDFRSYVEELRNDEQIKQAFLEFAESYEPHKDRELILD
ncbi:extracellular solute-binding protein [Gracilibacillus alcaliphilus]|uniref:extracellular solute-binding protein n=1 Tax=Gracilibacillus alcaliphilus TaxID=1401441 RepID=UPI00195743A2|nr:extracellular solute-binding protein [Gracilibacillus alcaliphilus]MBM7679107.1 putative aldouronate transport system substrate-binding protein [Gracilibacillus alcaliphilus]